MDPKEIRELIEMISRSDFSSFELEEADGFKLKLEKAGATVQTVVEAPVVVPAAVPAVAPAPAPAPAAAPAASPAAGAAPAAPEAAPAPAVDAGLVDFPSPIVGTFYRASGPDADPFTDVGKRVSKGQVVCIVEAMKVMNEIESELAGEVVEVCVADGQPVEFGEVLFRLRP